MRYKGDKGKAWEALRKYVIARDGNKCVTCWRTGDEFQVQGGHYLPMGLCGSNNKLGFDELNVHCQCAYCNMVGQGQQELMGQHINRKYGEGTTDKLRKRLGKVDKVEDWKKLKELYEEKMQEL